jgi:hypothetical protein
VEEYIKATGEKSTRNEGKRKGIENYTDYTEGDEAWRAEGGYKQLSR